MNRVLRAVLILALWMSGDVWAGDPLLAVTEKAMARVRPSLVKIQVVWVEYAGGREVKRQASGSGFIITRKGHVVTNHHVAGRATRIVCIFSNNEEIEATLVGTDPLTDVAVLKLDDSKHKQFPFVEFADSSKVVVGDMVLAMGSPRALSQSVTRGIVSNVKMIMPGSFRGFDRFTMEGEDVGSLVRWIAHDAVIFPGNSGGPLVNLEGKVIGVNEIGFGLGGAIPGNLAKEVAEQIIANGKVTRAWIGLEVQPLLKKSDQSRGVLVSRVVPDSPADKSGFQAGDVVLKLAGQDCTVRFDEEIPLFNLLVCGLTIGKAVDAVILRDGREQKMKVTPTEREPLEFRTREVKEWGITVRNISSLAAREMRLDDKNGVLVTSVWPGGPSGRAKPPMGSLDVIRKVGGQEVRSVEEFLEVTGAITKESKAPVPTIVNFDRRHDKLLTVVNVGVRDMEDAGVEARKAWLPVKLQAITRDMAAAFGTNSLTGVRVTQVYPNSTASAAGLQVGDLIVLLDGERIPAQQDGDEEVFTNRIRQYRVGAKPELTVLRGKETLKVTVELDRSPPPERELGKYEDVNFEFSVRELNIHDRVARDLDETFEGVLVTVVAEGSWAALGGLFVGDLILRVEGNTIKDAASLEAQMKKVAEARPKFVEMLVKRGTRTRYVELEPVWSNHVAAP